MSADKSHDVTTDPATTFSCIACKRPDSTDDLVACDECNCWWHYSCAGVTGSVSERHWTCSKCLPVTVAKSVSLESSTTSRRVRLELNLQRLEEQRKLENKRLELEKRYITEKFQILEESLRADDEDNRSVRSKVPTTDTRGKQAQVSDWVQSQKLLALHENPLLQQSNPLSRVAEHLADDELGAVGGTETVTQVIQRDAQQVQPSVYQAMPAVPTAERQCSFRQLQHQLLKCQNQSVPDPAQLRELQRLLTNCQIEAEQSRNQSTSASKPDASKGAIPKIIPAQEITNPPQRSSRFPDVISPPANNGVIRNPTPIVPTFSMQNDREEWSRLGQFSVSNISAFAPIYATPPIAAPPRPTPEQLSARQVMPRDLPDFYGEPEEWPLFVSSFNNSTAACGYSNAENLARLQRCLKGNALKSVRYYLLSPESVSEVMKTLETLYGRPEVIISRLIKNVRETPAPRIEKLETLIDYGIAVRNLTQHLVAAGQHAHLSNPVLVQELVEKLPANIKLQWAERLHYLPATLQTFSEFMAKVVESVSKIVIPTGHSGARTEKFKTKEKGYIHAHNDNVSVKKVASKSEVEKPCVICNRNGHRVKDCVKFKDAGIETRWKSVHALNICRNCLNLHGRRACRSSNRCGVNGCQFRHHPLLHTVSNENKSASVSLTENHTHHHSDQSVLFRIIPVTLYGESATIDTFAFLDEGSSATLIEQNLAKQLGVSGPNVPLCLQWTAKMSRTEDDSQLISFEMSGVNNAKRFRLENARTVHSLNLPTQTLRFDQLQERFEHLRGLPVQSYEHATPKLLVGLRDLTLAVPQKIREGKEGPAAAKTRLGWCVYGSFGKCQDTRQFSYHICDCAIEEKLDGLLKEYFSIEDTGISTAEPLESEAVKRAWKILRETTQRIGDRFQTGLLWRCDRVELPDSLPMAIRRLECLERRMNRDPALKEEVHRQIREYLDKGYTHRAAEAELACADPMRVWYLPLGVVQNPKKPGKVRLVWDAAAKVNGTSLNDLLLPGPDMLLPLPSVLFRFRQFPVAVCGDIKQMFHQILVKEADKHSQRFLWRDKPKEPPSVYIMDVVTFGATSSPSSAQFIKNQNALEFADRFPRAAEAILKCHYVDDYLESFETVREAQEVAGDVRFVHSKGGFEIRNWSSNSKAVLDYLGEKANATEKNLSPATNNFERVLGMRWLPKHDMLSFPTSFSEDIMSMIQGNKRPTKRQILKCIMSLFDPLGLLASFLIHGKIVMQEVWRSGIAWDEPVGDKIFAQWKRWTEKFADIDRIEIPRCYFSAANAELYKSLQAHVFVDASEEAYAAAVYFRVIKPDGSVQCTLISAKTKVAPLKYVSIPRLELMAAAIGARLLTFVEQYHSVAITRRFLWSDSHTVLCWIRSEHRKYRQFVACRIGEILSLTKECEWRWVPSKSNVADEATKWGKGPCFDADSRWYVGPSFLYQAEDHWPTNKHTPVTTSEELRPCFIHTEIVTPEPLMDVVRFSKWKRLQRATAYVIKIGQLWKARLVGCRKGCRQLEQQDLKEAEKSLWKQAQLEAFPNEIVILRRNEGLPIEKQCFLEKSSPLYKLSPMLDKDGVLHIDGRINAVISVPETIKSPIILPKGHRITFLLIDHYHRKYLHANAETVVNELRQRFYVPHLRTLVRKISTQCQVCKISKARPEIPRMGPLPAGRLSPFVRPFSFVGLDYFGPLLVKVGRSNAKRWIAVFTCLTVRAVHVEVVYSLTTQSCIACIRRFVKRRGAPLVFYSDNGRNFVGAASILRNQIKEINQESAATFTNTNTNWLFIPPAAPSMGGSWERMVRSIKTAMSSLPGNCKLDDEGLLTLVIEAEAIVNSRPLTYLPLDSEEQEALTPNHFILGSSSGIKEPTAPTNCVETVRNSWHQILVCLNHFWKRWVREYLPTLTRRNKWHDEVRALMPDDLVIVIDETKRNGWIRGRVLEVIAGPDGRVRHAVVQTADGLYRRPVSKIAVLEVSGKGKAEAFTHPYGVGDVGNPDIRVEFHSDM